MAQANNRKERAKWKYIAVTVGIVSFLLFGASIALITIGCLNPYGSIGLSVLGGGTILFLATEAFLCMGCIWVKNNNSADEMDFTKKQVGTSKENISLFKPAANITSPAVQVLKPRDESVSLDPVTLSQKTSISNSSDSTSLESPMSPDWPKRTGEQQYQEMKNISNKTVAKSIISKQTQLCDKTDSQVEPLVTSQRTNVDNQPATSRPKQSNMAYMAVKPKPRDLRILVGDQETKINSSVALPIDNKTQFVKKYNKPQAKVQHLNPAGDSSTTVNESRECKKTLHDVGSDLHTEKKHWVHHKQDRTEIPLLYVSSKNNTPTQWKKTLQNNLQPPKTRTEH